MADNFFSLDSFDQRNNIEFLPKQLTVKNTEGKGGAALEEGPLQSIKMPIPRTLSDNLQINYTAVDNLKSTIMSGIGSAIDKATGNGVITDALKKTGDLAGVSRIPEQMQNFSGLEQSDWIFDWQFIFRSKQEFEELVGYISLFRRIAAGEGATSEVGQGVGNAADFVGLTIKKPCTWEIKLNSGSSLGKILTYPKNLVLTKVISNFDGNNGISFFKGGEAPVMINFSLTFMSAKTVTAADFIEGARTAAGLANKANPIQAGFNSFGLIGNR